MLQSCQFPKKYRDQLKVEIKIASFYSYGNCTFCDEDNISKEEHAALKGMFTIKDIVIQKLDKGNSVLVLNKNMRL